KTRRRRRLPLMIWTLMDGCRATDITKNSTAPRVSVRKNFRILGPPMLAIPIGMTRVDVSICFVEMTPNAENDSLLTKVTLIIIRLQAVSIPCLLATKITGRYINRERVLRLLNYRRVMINTSSAKCWKRQKRDSSDSC